MRAKSSGLGSDAAALERRARSAVAEIVRKQAEVGIDVITDGEQSKPGFFTYVAERLNGFEPRPGAKLPRFHEEAEAFPEYYKEYFAQAMLGGAAVPSVPLVCVGPVSYKGIDAVRRDIENLKAALEGVKYEDVFLPSVAPSGVGLNEYYKTEEEYLIATGEALREEYRAIVDAGFLLQVDDPFLTELFGRTSVPYAERRKMAEAYAESVNHALRGIPAEKVRFHTCYGINEGPRVHDAPLKDVAEVMLKINAGAYSFENANARHEHEYHLWESVKLRDDKVLIPGVMTHASNIVEHPELVAERIARFARLVGRERVIAGVDCGFSSQASYRPEIHPMVMWVKFQALVDGARLASKQLWN